MPAEETPVPLPLAPGVNTATPSLLMVHADHLGRPIRLTDASRTTVWQASYRPFGEVESILGKLEQNLRFPGQYFLMETGLSYNWHRFYDPTTGRYTQPYPLRFVDGPSVYGYAGANPFMRLDFNGMDWVDLMGGYYPDGGNSGAFCGQDFDPSQHPGLVAGMAGGFLGGVGAAVAGEVVLVAAADFLIEGEAAAAEDALAARVSTVHDVLDSIAANQRTTAGLDIVEGTRVLASGGRDLSLAQKALLNPGGVAARLPGAHAEIRALEHAAQS